MTSSTFSVRTVCGVTVQAVVHYGGRLPVMVVSSVEGDGGLGWARIALLLGERGCPCATDCADDALWQLGLLIDEPTALWDVEAERALGVTVLA